MNIEKYISVVILIVAIFLDLVIIWEFMKMASIDYNGDLRKGKIKIIGLMLGNILLLIIFRHITS